jgi:putative ABC transport system permease protein
MTDTPLIVLEDIGRVYRLGEASVRVLDRVHFTLGAGERCAVVGPSGSGKSTLLHILGLLDEADAGRYLLAGRDVSRASADERAQARNRQIGFVFQSFNLLPRLSALDNVALPLRYRGFSRGEARRRAIAQLHRVGLADRLRHRPADLSGGQRQRVAIARALAGDPALLLADEPTGNLDGATANEIMDTLLQLNEAHGLTLVVVTHDEALAQRLGRRLRVRDGRVVEDQGARREGVRREGVMERHGAGDRDGDDPSRLASLARALVESFDSLRRLGRRSMLALSGIAVGCAAVVALLNVGHNAALDALRVFEGLGADLLVANFTSSPGEAPRPAPATLDAATLAAVPGIRRAAPILSHASHVRQAGRSAEATVLGTTAELPGVLGLSLAQGRFLSEYDASSTYAVAGARVARALQLRLGDALRVDGTVFEVVGIAAALPRHPLVPVSADDAVFVPLEGMRRLLPVPEIHGVFARAREPARLDDAARALKAHLEKVSQGRAVDVQIPRRLLDGLSRQSRTFTYLLGGLGALSLIVGGAGVMNVMLMAVSERRREIGARLALGARGRDIRDLFLGEAAMLSAAGALAGALLGLSAAYAFVRFSGWRFALSAPSLPLGVLSALAVGLASGLYPALSAARLVPVQALRDD